MKIEKLKKSMEDEHSVIEAHWKSQEQDHKRTIDQQNVKLCNTITQTHVHYTCKQYVIIYSVHTGIHTPVLHVHVYRHYFAIL